MPLALRNALAGLALAVPALALAADDPVAGRTLFNDTPSSGGAGITMSCPACHGSVEDRRARISGTDDPFADISFDTAMTRFAAAVQNQSAMQPFRTLTQQQARDIAAYIADTPETLPEHESQLDFTATAVNTTSAAQTVTIKHAVATSDTLTIVGVAAFGTEAGNFSVQPVCNGLVLPPAGSCQFTVTYAPRNANVSAPELVVTLRQGSSQTGFERVLFLSGSIASAPPAGGGAEDSGGGALDARWLAALALAVGLLARCRRCA